MSDSKTFGSNSEWTPVALLVCVIASIGFAFDIYELLMLPLIVRPALQELLGAEPGSPEFQMWVGRLFYIPAFAGGIFGLLGGYLTDRLGRRRRAYVEHSSLCVLGFLCRSFDVDLDAALSAVHDVHRRVRGICCGRGVVGGAVPQSPNEGTSTRLYTGLLLDRWFARSGRQRVGRAVRCGPAGHPRAGVVAVRRRRDCRARTRRGATP